MTRSRRSLALFAIAIVITFALTVFIWRTKAQTVINPGYDQFSTPSNATSSETLSLPAGAITDAAGNGSEAFSGPVTFEGGPAVSGYTGDTVIERTQSVTVPGSTALQVIGLNLVSVGTISVTFTDGTSANYSVSVSQSPSTASTGTMSFASGGSFNNSLSINVEYTFTSSGEPTATFDAAPNGLPAIGFTSSGTWTVDGTTSSGDNVSITPQTEQAQLASHGITPAPSPTPTPTVIPCIVLDNPLAGDDASHKAANAASANPDELRCISPDGVIRKIPKK